METYTTIEGMVHCANCGSFLGDADKSPAIKNCGACTQMENIPEDEENFEHCDECDIPDACSDFGCAIKHGIREHPRW